VLERITVLILLMLLIDPVLCSTTDPKVGDHVQVTTWIGREIGYIDSINNKTIVLSQVIDLNPTTGITTTNSNRLYRTGIRSIEVTAPPSVGKNVFVAVIGNKLLFFGNISAMNSSFVFLYPAIIISWNYPYENSEWSSLRDRSVTIYTPIYKNLTILASSIQSMQVLNPRNGIDKNYLAGQLS
jgi:hypothetical protein